MAHIYKLEHKTPEVSDAGYIAPNAVVIGDVVLHDLASVWFGVTLRADDDRIEIGARSNIQDHTVAHVDPGFPLTVGEDCTIGHSVVLHGCTIGDNTLVGMRATIMNGARIGRNCVIGAGALITEGKEIPDNSLVVGAPGKVLRRIDENTARDLTKGAAYYVARCRRYAEGLSEIS